MASDDSNIETRLSVGGTKEFAEDIDRARKAISELGDTESLKGLIGNFKELGLAAGVIGGSILALKTGLDLTLEAESVEAINYQFELLAKNAGVSADHLRDGLKVAANGLIDDTDLLKVANEQMLRFGDSAAKLPEVMELARKSSALTGKSLIETFTGMSEAISSGNARALKQYNIFVDQKKAVNDYADANNYARDAITQAGNRQAILNAALEDGRKRFADVRTDLHQTSDALTQIKVIGSEMLEILALGFKKTFGSTFTEYLGSFKAGMSELKTSLLAAFGDGAEGAEAKVNKLSTELYQLQEKLNERQGKKPGVLEWLFDTDYEETYKRQIRQVKEELQKAQAELENSNAKPLGPENNPGGSSGGSAEQEKQDKDKLTEINLKYHHDLLAMQEQTTSLQLQNALNEIDLANAQKQQRLQIEENLAQQIAEIRRRALTEKIDGEALITEAEEQASQKKLNLERQTDSQVNNMLNNNLRTATGVADGIGKGFAAGSKRAGQEMKNFGKLGEATFNNFSKHAVSSLIKLGEGTEDATDIMRGFIFGMLADEAQARGALMLAASVWPPQPPGLAGGAALLVLSGVLRSLAGGSAKSAGSVGGDTGGGASSLSPGDIGGSPGSVAQTEQQKKVVTLTINGNLYETEETKTKLVELMRQASDATDLTIQSVRGGF